jgi:putative transposase
MRESMKTLNPALAKVLKRLHYPLEVILTCVRWYVAYPPSLRHLEEMMAERGTSVDHSTVHRWALKLLPVLEKAFRSRERPVGKSWRMDETYIRVKGEWKYLYRAVDKDGNTIAFLLRARRDKTAARRYFEKSIAQNGVPETVTIDKSGANLAALEAVNADRETPIKIRQSKYLNNLVEQDHRAVKRRTRPMLGFKTFRCARILLGSIELMHMITKRQMKCARGTPPSAPDQFYKLATGSTSYINHLSSASLTATKPLSTHQYARLAQRWVRSIGLDDTAYGTHTMQDQSIADLSPYEKSSSCTTTPPSYQ